MSEDALRQMALDADTYDHETFNLIGKLLTDRDNKWEKIYLDEFGEYKYIVVVFRGGGTSVRNALANSLTANLSSMVKMLNGGYYDEVKEYRELKTKFENAQQ